MGGGVMSYNYSKLRGKIIEKFGTYKNFAKAMDTSERTLSLKLNNKIFWKQDEIEKAIELLTINKKDILIYFFNINVQ